MVDAFLAPLAVGKLPGVGKVMEAKLAGLGIATCTDLRLHGAAALEQRFGRWGRRLHELAAERAEWMASFRTRLLSEIG